MAWNTPYTFTSGEVVSASRLNAQIRDNMNYLLNGRPFGQIVREGTSDYTTTNTTFTPVDATNLRHTLTPNSGRIKLTAMGQWSNSGDNNMYMDFILDNAGAATRVGGTSGLRQQRQGNNGTSVWPFTVVGVFTGLSATSHTFDLAWRVNAGTVTGHNNPSPIYFMAEET